MRLAAAAAMSAALGALACGRSDGPLELDPAIAFALSVEDQLAPGTTKVKWFEPMPATYSLGTVYAGQSALTPDSSLVSIEVAHGVSVDGRGAQDALFRFDASGVAERLELPSDAVLPSWLPSSTPSAALLAPGGGLVVQCGLPEVGLRLEGDRVVTAPVPSAACDGLGALGPSVVAGRVARALWVGNGQLELGSLGADGAPGSAATVTAPAGSTVLAVAELAPDRVVAWIQGIGSDVLVEASGASRQAPAHHVAVGQSRGARVSGSVFTLFTDLGGAIRWDVDAPGSVPEEVLPAPVPEGFDPWQLTGIPGAPIAAKVAVAPNDDRIVTPLEFSVSHLGATGFEVRAAPSTPCRTRSGCRRVGESYLVAALEAGERAFGVYAFWAWSGPLALYLSPLDRGEVP